MKVWVNIDMTRPDSLLLYFPGTIISIEGICLFDHLVASLKFLYCLLQFEWAVVIMLSLEFTLESFFFLEYIVA